MMLSPSYALDLQLSETIIHQGGYLESFTILSFYVSIQRALVMLTPPYHKEYSENVDVTYDMVFFYINIFQVYVQFTPPVYS